MQKERAFSSTLYKGCTNLLPIAISIRKQATNPDHFKICHSIVVSERLLLANKDRFPFPD